MKPLKLNRNMKNIVTLRISVSILRFYASHYSSALAFQP